MGLSRTVFGVNSGTERTSDQNNTTEMYIPNIQKLLKI